MYVCDKRQDLLCDTASSIKEAMAMIDAKRYDLIVLDLLLGGEIGIKVIEHARARWKDNPPDLCIISAMQGAKRIAEENNVINFIPKPFDLEIVDELILREKYY